ncbi:12397_t:CDS:1, partial [Cetraspora pellucida]
MAQDIPTCVVICGLEEFPGIRVEGIEAKDLIERMIERDPKK